ncbi:Peptidyl-tRNA hydrolase 2, mitochondrial [Smittium culicis]|uniref:peptidyl-tRNA hydrolase n=1 Tax=Smittium culicis TaxID=133412 RepID=A0A1R1YSK6_9FUNG|nr:Peptidyl-tRNA hydrolase 2, mitochondrial [Smittium culicis]
MPESIKDIFSGYSVSLVNTLLLIGGAFFIGAYTTRKLIPQKSIPIDIPKISKKDPVLKTKAKTRLDYTKQSKLVLVIRTDLGMTKGKVAAQCCHATLACYKSSQKKNPEILRHWEETGQAKVTLKCNSEEEMLELYQSACSQGLVAQYIQDAGRTQIAAGSRTVLGIGPNYTSNVDAVTGNLKLY